MASPQVGSVPPKLSFAKVAAMKAPSVPTPTNNISEDKKSKSLDAASRRKTMISTKPQSPIQAVSPQAEPTPQLAEAIPGQPALEPDSSAAPLIPSANGTKSAESGDSVEDDQSHLSGSSTKQHSFETKSMASVTTFAMDEKESIRPDDSASVRAVDDEEAARPLSRNATFQIEPDVIMPALRGGGLPGTQSNVVPVRRFHTLTNPPRFGTLEEPTMNQPDEAETTVSSEPAESIDNAPLRMPPPPVSPDEKLLDALASPKDRLSLLQLEEKFLGFIGQSVNDYVDLPPQHAYARLLAHKLADYYGLQHYINEDGTSIRVFRTSANPLPTPLAALAKSIPVGSSQSLGLHAVKIMRRAGIGSRQFSTTDSTAASSSAPSKTTSEAGHSEEGLISPTEASTPSRDRSKLTREEREAQYKAARERIFGNMEELSINENHSTGENSASLSRSSSSSGKKKTRKQRVPKDDSFDSRSAFVASYGPMHVQQVQAQYQSQQYVDQSYQTQYDASPGDYGPQMNYGSTPTQAFPTFEQSMLFNNPVNYGPNPGQPFGGPEAWSPIQSPPPGGYFNYPQGSAGHQQNVAPMMNQMSHQYSQQPPPTMQQQQQGWNNQYQTPYQQPMTQQAPNMSWQGYQPYPQQYGQLQGSQMGSQMGNQMGSQMQAQFPPNAQSPYTAPHPQAVPVSVNNNMLNRPGTLFNPQTKTFVPSNAPNRSGHRSHRKKNSPNPTHNQSGQSSVGKSHPLNNPSSVNSQPLRTQEVPNARNGHDSLQQKYGKPANLPKKPPPPQATSQFDASSIQGVRNASGGLSTNVIGTGSEGKGE